MSELIAIENLLPQWQLHAAQIAQLFAAVPAGPDTPILCMLPGGQAQAAVLAAAAHIQREVVVLPADAAQDVAGVVIAKWRPGIVVCSDDVFGWVSKLAFLNEVAAIYTCDTDAHGTLLGRASHFNAGVLQLHEKARLSLRCLDAQGAELTQ